MSKYLVWLDAVAISVMLASSKSILFEVKEQIATKKEFSNRKQQCGEKTGRNRSIPGQLSVRGKCARVA